MPEILFRIFEVSEPGTPSINQLKVFLTVAESESFTATVADDPAELRVAQADFVVRLFASGYPAETPFEQPAHFEMAINARVAAAIGATSRALTR